MAPTDRRQCLLSLTAKGRMAFAPLDQRSQNEIAAMIGKLSVADQERIVGAIGVIGPTRINYGRVIPVVDYTARVIGRLLG